MSDIKQYDSQMEYLFLRFLISEPDLFARCLSIINPEHYRDTSTKEIIKFIKTHVEKYSVLPTTEQISTVTNTDKIEKLEDITPQHEEWFLDEYEKFARHRALELAILESVELLEKSRYGEVETKIKDAVSTGLVKDLGMNYFDDPKSRLLKVLQDKAQITTGYRDLDRKLFGGLNKGEITIFLGQSGAGKSLFLQNISLNWAKEGLNIIYISFELNESLCSMRLDAMTSDYGTSDVLKNIDDVDFRVRKFHKDNKGGLWIKQMPIGSNVNDIKAYLKELSVQTGIKFDGMAVDYVDLMESATRKTAPGDTFTKDKYVSEELRNLASEQDVLMISASQLNRSSYSETDFDNSHVAGGISKVYTADNVIGIHMTNAMRDIGRYELQFMKTRSSSGVGSKITLELNRKTLRISDYDDTGEDDTDNGDATKNVINKIKKRETVTSANKKKEETDEDRANRLIGMIK